MTAAKLVQNLGLTLSLRPFEKKYKIGKMGTSGLREKQAIYNQPLFLEQFIQGVADHFNSLDNQFLESKNRTIVLGGDPRLGNKERIYKAAEILAANGFKVLIAAYDDHVASTPAMSHAIRHQNAVAGIVFTASHNPFTDVGIKINTHDGAPALEDTVDSVHQFQNNTALYKTTDFEAARANGRIDYVDTVKLYGDLLDKIFNFADMKLKIKAYEKKLGRSLKIALDGMGGAAGPYLTEIFVNRLGLNPEILRGTPDEYLGGPNDENHPNHPEPDFDFIPDLISKNMTKLYDLVSANDSDVDRRINGGNGFWLESADEFALFAKYGHLIGVENLYQDAAGKAGEIVFARSTVTAGTIDLMENYLKEIYGKKGYTVRILQTSTGFKYIAEYGNFGVEESNGVGNPWLREKDGVFASAFLLKIILETSKTVQELMEEVWQKFGRIYFTRGEISNAPKTNPKENPDEYNQELLMLNLEKTNLENSIKEVLTQDRFLNKKYGDLTLQKAHTWQYIDPKGQLRDKNGAWVFEFDQGITIKARFSGTGSGGYCLRVYVTKFDKRYNLVKKEITGPAKKAIAELIKAAGFNAEAPKAFTDENQPDAYAVKAEKEKVKEKKPKVTKAKKSK
jgi:phosphoglucomutase